MPPESVQIAVILMVWCLAGIGLIGWLAISILNSLAEFKPEKKDE